VRALYRWWATLLFACVVVQVGFAGFGAFFVINKVDDDRPVTESEFEDGFVPHSVLGYLILLLGLIFLLIGAGAGIGKWRLGRHGVLFALLILQLLLAWIGFGVPAVGFLHPVNALVIFSLLGWIVSDEWRRRAPTPGSPAALDGPDAEAALQ
jgi:hypothetical protein